ncbi:MAG: PEP-CTERM/exosortase system-associated acyltransferase [Thermodesulfobacteriota bacterium]|nr:PEP-CTERM/exosortase system-associated acyltransferase [Thermodesulfobacteriota bacterium]
MFTIGGFKFVQADSEDLRAAIYRLRYKVYVEEFGFERPEDHPGGIETDAYEPYSIHFAALNENQEIIGTLRLVLNSEKGFPIEHAVRRINFIGKRPHPDRIAEISRLAVSKDYRRRKEDGFYGVESYLVRSEGGVLPDDGPMPGEYEKRKRPVIVLGLYRLVYHASKRRGISHLFLITEKKLFYALKRYGLLFNQIGEPVSYHGLRIPYLGIVDEIEERLAKDKPKVLKLMLNGLEKRYHPKLATP